MPKEIREKIYKILLPEYGRVIKRELNKSQSTLSTILAEGNTYFDFLSNQIENVESIIGKVTEGSSLLEKIYIDRVGDDNFDKITSKNLILLIRYRIDNLIQPDNFEDNPVLLKVVHRFTQNLDVTSEALLELNLRANLIRNEFFQTIEPHFIDDDNKWEIAKEILNIQSLQMNNIFTGIFVQKLNSTLHEERKLKSELLAKQKILENELKQAQKIQQNLLPKAFPTGTGLRFYTRYIPLNSVGGDFYDVAIVPTKVNQTNMNRVGVIVSDVSGHGVSSAFIASMIKIIWMSSLKDFDQPKSILKNMNLSLTEVTAGNFLTVFLGIFEIKNNQNINNNNSQEPVGIFNYSTAGHFSPYILRKNGQSEILDIRGQLLGIFPSIRLDEKSISIYSGDRFVFYTDGLFEVRNTKKELLGEDRLFELFEKGRSLRGEDFCEYVISNIQVFKEEHSFDDDITLLVIDIVQK